MRGWKGGGGGVRKRRGRGKWGKDVEQICFKKNLAERARDV